MKVRTYKNKQLMTGLVIVSLIGAGVICLLGSVGVALSTWDFVGRGIVERCSADFTDLTERLEFLNDYRNFYSEITDTEFCIWHAHNGFAPDEWDYQIMLKVSPEDVDVWINEYSGELYQGYYPSRLLTIAEDFYSSFDFDLGPLTDVGKGTGSVVIFSADQIIENNDLTVNLDGRKVVVIFENGLILVRDSAQ